MKLRNIIVQQNDRIEYILIDRGCKPGTPETQDLKAEDYNFQQENSDWVKVDYLYYLEKQFVKPLNEILRVVTFQPKLIKDHLEHRIQKKIMTSQLYTLNMSKITFIEDTQLNWTTRNDSSKITHSSRT